MSVADEINKLHQALEAGALTQEEFAAQKAKLLAAPAPLTAEQRRMQVSQASDEDPGALKYVVPIHATGASIVAGYLGLFSLIPGAGIFAIGAGLIALRGLKKQPGKAGKGRAMFAIIFGGLSLVGYGLIFGLA